LKGGAVVLKDIPENSTAVGVPARVVRGKSVEKEQTLDQLNIPDPVAQELSLLRSRIEELEKRLNEKD
jgi:serine O-acetyltransferase